MSGAVGGRSPGWEHKPKPPKKWKDGQTAWISHQTKKQIDARLDAYFATKVCKKPSNRK